MLGNVQAIVLATGENKTTDETSSFSSRCLPSNRDLYQHTNNVIQGKAFECLKSNIDKMLQKITGEREFQDDLASTALAKGCFSLSFYPQLCWDPVEAGSLQDYEFLHWC